MLKLKYSVIIAVLLAVLLFIAGCASKPMSDQKSAYAASNASAGLTNEAAQSTTDDSENSPSTPQISRKIVKSATITAETLTYDKTISKFEALAY